MWGSIPPHLSFEVVFHSISFCDLSRLSQSLLQRIVGNPLGSPSIYAVALLVVAPLLLFCELAIPKDTSCHFAEDEQGDLYGNLSTITIVGFLK